MLDLILLHIIATKHEAFTKVNVTTEHPETNSFDENWLLSLFFPTCTLPMHTTILGFLEVN